jgi:diguanylate cyclase (GGDEF)-like protein/PAS domain S-box-containing protein
MPFSLRFSTILLYFSVYFLSYKVEWINNRIEKITHLVLTISVFQLLYYNHIFNFRLKTAGLILIAILTMNLIFKADRFSFIINLLIGILMGLSLWITNKGLEFSVFFFSSYILVSSLSFYIKYYLQEEKKMKIRIKGQKDRLSWIIEGTGSATWEWNIQTGKTFFNKKWTEMLGYKLEEIEPTSIKTWEKFTHPEDLKKAKNELEKHFKGESEQYDIEIRMKHKDGHWVWMNDRGRVVSWTKDNKPLKMFGIHLDITERKEREEKIEVLAASMENISDSVMITDTNFKIEYINEAGEKLFGYSLEEIEGETPAIFNAEENASGIQQEIYEIVSNGNMYKTEFLNRRKDGSAFICEMKATPLENDEGEIYAHIGIQRDITKRKKQHDKLKYQYKFQKTLAEISSNLLEISSANIDRKINISLKKIGEFFDVDRSYIFQESEKNEFLFNTHEWFQKRIKSEKKNLQNIPATVFPWWMEKLAQNEFINIPDVNKMPKKAASEQKILQEQNIKSVVVIPMFIANEFFGFFGFDSVKKKKKFSNEEIQMLKIFTDIITNAFSKYIDDKKIRKLTYKDSLTGLYNRRFFEEELERLDTKRQLPISIIVADINGLKIINDSLGHKKGDHLLKKSAEILKESTRKEDILARQGGDEFAILLPKTGKETAEKIIARIKEKSRQTNDDELTVTMALGVAVKNDSNQSIEDILRTADNAMYQNKLSESRSTKSRIVQSLLKNLEIKSYETREHTERMKKLAVDFGKELGLAKSELNRLSLLAKLHDIGKITVDEKILKKAGSLTDAEWEIMKKHPEKGYQIASSSQKFAVVADDIFTHHERWDGSGYPQGLSGDNITYLARIINIIDSYDVMTHDRPYSQAISKEEALTEIKSCAGSQFDPKLAEAFIKMVKND